jgi:cytoskeletal protein CcmA (bactofilin family)
MKKILTFVLAFAVATTAMGQGRLGGFLNKAKEAVSSEVKSDNKENRNTGSFSSGNAIHVSSLTGSNRNDGSKAKPYKNLQKAIDNAKPGDVILVAQGNYFGMLNSGNIVIDKPLTIMGGYSDDFSTRDILKYRSMVQPDATSNGTAKGGGTIQIKGTHGGEVVIDGLLIDRGNSVAYNPAGKGKSEGVESPMMQPIGTAGIGGANFEEKVYTTETALIYLDNPTCNIKVRNCAFVNSPNYGIRGMFKGKMEVDNCIFINIRMAAMEVSGSYATEYCEVKFTNNTVLFTWSRLKDMADMGYGYRYMNGVHSYLDHNIIGCSIFSGLDRCRIDSNAAREREKVTTCENSLFFLNKQADICLPGGGMFLRVWVKDFDDVEQLAEVSGNKSVSDPSIFNGALNEPYLKGFIEAAYNEKTNFDPNSGANVFRQAMGMNMQGTIDSSASMFANRYPFEDALKFFGAVRGYGAQLP